MEVYVYADMNVFNSIHTTICVNVLQRDLRDSDVDVVTLGQYLRPSRRHMSVQRYVPPEVSSGLIRIPHIHTLATS